MTWNLKSYFDYCFGSHWVGMKYDDSTNQFIWIDGTIQDDSVFSRWAQDRPYDDPLKCVLLHDTFWKDYTCTSYSLPLCMLDVAGI